MEFNGLISQLPQEQRDALNPLFELMQGNGQGNNLFSSIFSGLQQIDMNSADFKQSPMLMLLKAIFGIGEGAGLPAEAPRNYLQPNTFADIPIEKITAPNVAYGTAAVVPREIFNAQYGKAYRMDENGAFIKTEFDIDPAQIEQAQFVYVDGKAEGWRVDLRGGGQAYLESFGMDSSKLSPELTTLMLQPEPKALEAEVVDPTDPRNVYTFETHELGYGKVINISPNEVRGSLEGRTKQNDVFSFESGEEATIQPDEISSARMYYRDGDAIGYLVNTKDGGEYLVGPEALEVQNMSPEKRAELGQMDPQLQQATPSMQPGINAANPYASMSPQ